MHTSPLNSFRQGPTDARKIRSPNAYLPLKFISPSAGPRSRQPRDPTNRRNARNRKNTKNRMIPGIIQGIRRITETRESRRCFLESREYRECRENREPRGSKETVRGTPSEILQPSDPCILESWDHKNPGNPGRPMCTGRARHHYCKKTGSCPCTVGTGHHYCRKLTVSAIVHPQ